MSTSCYIFNYLDDFLVVTEGYNNSVNVVDNILLNSQELGLPIASDKTVLPCTSLTFLGIGINTEDASLYIPDPKHLQVLGELQGFLQLERSKVKRWQKIIGKLSHLSQVVVAGRAHLNSLYSSLTGKLSSSQNVRRRISQHARKELNVWLSFLADDRSKKPFKVIFPSTHQAFEIWTEAASLTGFGAIWNDNWFYGSWPEPSQLWREHGMSFLELVPIFIALHMWSETFTESVVLIHTDNEALVPILNNLYSKDQKISALLRPIALLCMQNNMVIIAKHIAGKLNVGADLLSRGRIPQFRVLMPGMEELPVVIPTHLQPAHIRATLLG
jgi:hypothetical protein